MKTATLKVTNLKDGHWSLKVSLDNGQKFDANTSDAKLVGHIQQDESHELIKLATVAAIQFVLDTNDVDYQYVDAQWTDMHGYIYIVDDEL
jgi:hypothetical protein